MCSGLGIGKQSTKVLGFYFLHGSYKPGRVYTGRGPTNVPPERNDRNQSRALLPEMRVHSGR